MEVPGLLKRFALACLDCRSWIKPASSNDYLNVLTLQAMKAQKDWRKELEISTGHYRGMKFDRDGSRYYRNCGNCLDTELTPAHIFDCPTILTALQKIGVHFSSTTLYVDNIEEIARSYLGPQYYFIWSRHGYGIIAVHKT
ncbi:uncharacterized protein TNCV_1822361 [Trichonephila clavipes]|nr:uncharacterized protein TNCV_1822361 [Trichonephila clavipes]